MRQRLPLISDAGEYTGKYRGTEERVTIPDTVEVVGESAFENNQKVQFVVIPKSVKRLEAYVFGDVTIWKRLSWERV